MKDRYLEITYRKGKPLAAYYYLPRQPNDKSARSITGEVGLRTDYTDDNRPIGIEITAPTKLTMAAFNRALAVAQQEPAAADELAPLLAARPPAPARS